ncbi:hypothetical protein NKJ46_22505 [Mesorhizobium sp. M0166]|uniref:hypothetical protein n=1 Tax=Mesorhizobium sp. M0166 TaxID=2956902 RepID=UPI00333AFAF6
MLLFEPVGDFDALICTAGVVDFAALDQITTELFDIAVRSKLMGQVNEDPRKGVCLALLNGDFERFVRASSDRAWP